MKSTVYQLKELTDGTFGYVIYSTKNKEIVSSHNQMEDFPLASAGKLAIGYAVAMWVEEGTTDWNEKLENVSLDPNEDSHILYPHFQWRKIWTLADAVEVMIACHDNMVANSIVAHFGGWSQVCEKVQSEFPGLYITSDPMNQSNKGQLLQVSQLLCAIYENFTEKPDQMLPIMNGLVRQNGEIESLPPHLHNQMTGGLLNAILVVGILGEFKNDPLLYVVGAKQLPDRDKHLDADETLTEVIKDLYQTYLGQG